MLTVIVAPLAAVKVWPSVTVLTLMVTPGTDNALVIWLGERPSACALDMYGTLNNLMTSTHQ